MLPLVFVDCSVLKCTAVVLPFAVISIVKPFSFCSVIIASIPFPNMFPQAALIMLKLGVIVYKKAFFQNCL